MEVLEVLDQPEGVALDIFSSGQGPGRKIHGIDVKGSSLGHQDSNHAFNDVAHLAGPELGDPNALEGSSSNALAPFGPMTSPRTGVFWTTGPDLFRSGPGGCATRGSDDGPWERNHLVERPAQRQRVLQPSLGDVDGVGCASGATRSSRAGKSVCLGISPEVWGSEV